MTKIFLKASAAAVRQYIRAADALGINYHFRINELGIDLERSSYISAEQLEPLLEYLIRQAPTPFFGLHSGQFVHPQSYPILGTLSMHASSLEQAILRSLPYERLVGDMGYTQVQHTDFGVRLIWHCQATNTQIAEHMIDNVFSSWVGFARWLLNNQGLSPRKVWLSRTAPQETEVYESYFGCSVTFAAQHNAIDISREDLERRITQPNPELMYLLEHQAQKEVQKLEQEHPFLDLMKHQINSRMGQQKISLEDIARALNMSQSTLKRRLAQAGIRFQTLVNQIRIERYTSMMAHRDMSSARLAHALGFAEQRSLQRWLKQHKVKDALS